MPVRVGLKHIEIWNDTLEDTIIEYEAEPIIKDQIVFYGPSHYTRWSTKWEHRPLREDLVGRSGTPCCINRGFGSSCPEHQLYYYSRVIRPLAPRVLVYSSYGNSSAFGYSNEEAFELAQRVIMYALTDFPDIRVYTSGVNVSRKMIEEERGKEHEYNDMMREFAENTPRCTFFNPLEYEPLWNTELFVKDGVHFNQKGYDVFADFYRIVLKDELAQY